MISLRRFLELEQRVHVTRPPRPTPGKPDGVDEVLQQLAQHYRPGDAVGRKEMHAAGVSWRAGGSVRRWAESAGLWPYKRPPTGFEALAENRRKDGAS